MKIIYIIKIKQQIIRWMPKHLRVSTVVQSELRLKRVK